MYSSEPLPHFVDDYLRYLQESRPTVAALDGIHAHDDLLEDLGRPAIDADLRALAGFARRLSEIDPAGMTEVERAEHPVLADHIKARMFELEEVRTWEKNPHLYADTLASSLATQALFTFAPPTERARRVLSKLRQAPRLIQAARDNVKDPPGIFVKVGIETFNGALRFIEHDLPRAFREVDDLHLLGDLADASIEAANAIRAYLETLETELAPKARASFRLGRERFEQKLKLEEGLGLSSDRLLAIAERELATTDDAFRSAASKLNGGDPAEAWAKAKSQHPAPGELIKAAEQQLGELQAFVEKQKLLTLPESERVVVAPTPDFFRWSSASMWTPGPFETKPSRAYYYLTDVDRKWPTERQVEHLRDFNYGTLWCISIHEVYPGHFVQYQHLRKVESKVRKSIFFAPATCVEGWAHYCEEMMLEAGFGRKDPLVRLGQLQEALIRLVRFVVSIRLHTEDLSVEQGVRLFKEHAFLEEANARREAERGTFDPTYLVYSVGKLMLQKLRRDVEAKEGDAFSLRTFHDALLRQGNAPYSLHRRLMLGEASGAVLE
jgi:Bacterial protein of unknown function (DUF885)